MKKISLLASLTLLLTNCSPQKPLVGVAPNTPLPLKRLTQSPQLSGDLPKSVSVSPNGKHLSFLKAKENDFSVLDLWTFNLDTGEPSLLVDSNLLTGGRPENLSDEEAARRERKRISSTGIVQYQWSQQGDKILFPVNGDLYLYTLNTKNPVSRLTKTDSYELDPQFSPKGKFVSFVRDYNVFIIDLKTNTEKQVTFLGTKDKPFGIAEFIAQEEMRRHHGYFWSPNEKQLAITHVDNTVVKETERFEIYADKVNVVKQRYPYAGTQNTQVSIEVFKTALAGKQQNAVHVPIDQQDYYIPQIKWLPDTDQSTLFYTIQSRDQKTLDIMTFNTTTKNAKKVFSETDSKWVNIRHDYIFLKKESKILWISEKSGHSHAHLYDIKSGENKALTSGDWDIRSLKAVDEKKGVFYFTGTKKSPLENHLYRSSLKNLEEVVKISQESGYHSIVISNSPTFYLDYYSKPGQPTSLSLNNLSGKKKFFIKENKIDEEHPLFHYQKGFSKWEFLEFKRKGKPTLFYKVLKPKNFNASKKYPLIQYVYGGPGVQLVKKSWPGNSGLFQQILAQNNYIVLVADNRGTPGRGRKFERTYYHNFGRIEVEDQSNILSHYLKQNSFVNKDKIGVYGHSYGGYLSLMLLMQKPDLYKVAVSGAPVVDWSLYDTHYTERYIGTPQAKPDLYKQANVLSYTQDLKGKLLVVHGMADDNVLYKNSLILYSDLQEKELNFDIMAYPGAKHGISRKKSWQQHYLKTIFKYFQEHLKSK